MWATVSEQIRTDLIANSNLTALLTNGNNSIYPLVADDEEGDSFVNYTIKDNGYSSKDKARSFTIIIECWSNGYNASIAIADEVLNAIESAPSIYNYEGGQPHFQKEEIYYTELIINILK